MLRTISISRFANYTKDIMTLQQYLTCLTMTLSQGVNTIVQNMPFIVKGVQTSFV